MGTRTYRHSAYWYAYHGGYTHSDAISYAAQYLDMHSYYPRMQERPDGEWDGRAWFRCREEGPYLDGSFNPLLLGVALAMDIGVAMRTAVRRLADPTSARG